jgi:parallel beta-helix repeat protein
MARRRPSGARARVLRSVAVAFVVVIPSVAFIAPSSADEVMPQTAAAPERPEVEELSAEEAEMQASTLAAEDRRLIEIRTVTSLARWQGQNWKTPYRLGTPTGYTLVLTPRSEPYTVEDLLTLAPQTFLRMSDGGYLLGENIVVMARATLRLSTPGGLTLRLASGSDGFATIVSLGGELIFEGEEAAPVQITSWDVATGAVDELTTDGRAYIRAIGGQFEAAYVHASHLGFWSGRTGGIALTGTDRPNTGAITSGGADGASGGAPSVLDGVTWQPAGEIPAEPGLGFDFDAPELDYVSVAMQDVTVESNAFGLFVSGANGVQVSDSTFTHNLLGGVVFHRYVTNGVIARSTSNANVGDGFSLARATTGITISESTAIANTGSGFSLDGRALAAGPSAVGASLRSYGNNSVRGSTATDNGDYGVDVRGGFNIGVENNVIRGHDMGIVVNGPAEKVSVTGNTVSDSDRHGVALVNGVTGSTVTGNVVDGSSTGVYLRDSSAQVKGNTVEDARSHGVSLVGDVDGTDVSYNVLAGSGQSAFDANRSDGPVSSASNNTDGWHDTSPWYLWFKKLLQPMSALWSVLLALVIISAVRSRRANGVIEHPYAHQMSHQGHLPVPSPVTIDLTEHPVLVRE